MVAVWVVRAKGEEIAGERSGDGFSVHGLAWSLFWIHFALASILECIPFCLFEFHIESREARSSPV